MYNKLIASTNSDQEKYKYVIIIIIIEIIMFIISQRCQRSRTNSHLDSMNQFTPGSIQTYYHYWNTELALTPAKNATTTNLFNISTVHKEREQLEDRRNAGQSSCNCGDTTGQMAQPLMFMMMMMKLLCLF
jgi:hypothetical protein